jgi:hypothetical protein
VSGHETEAGLNRVAARSQSPFNVSRRAIMGGDADLPQRSSSPLKRRASSMDAEPDSEMRDDDVQLVPTHPPVLESGDAAFEAEVDIPRAMSVDIEPVADMEADGSNGVADKRGTVMFEDGGWTMELTSVRRRSVLARTNQDDTNTAEGL